MRDNEQLLGAFWFIRALFLGALLVATVQFFFRRWGFINRYIMFFVLLFASIVATHFNISIPVIGSIGLILFSATFYVAGYCYRKIENEWCYSKLSFVHFSEISQRGKLHRLLPQVRQEVEWIAK